jgi:glutamate:Na+ symporter, ESS family
VALVPFLMVQGGLGVLIAKLLGLHPFLGLIAGSITLAGGHGTGAAYVEKFGTASAIPGVIALTMTSATLGLVLGGVIGGPVAERLIRRFHLSGATAGDMGSDVIMGPAETPVTTVPLIGSLAAALVAVLIGQWLGRRLAAAPVTVPDFLLSLLVGGMPP